jgi:zinc transport system permease protein
MIEIFGYEFFRNALMVGLLASVACGVIGTYVVVKRMVALAGGVSHAAFGGIGLGYFLGVEPLLGAGVFTVASALGMGELSLRRHQHLDTLIGALWSGGMALGILFVYLAPGTAPDLFGYLFGNILLVPSDEVLVMALLDLIILTTVFLLYHEFFAVTFDEEYARVMNLPVERIYLLLLVLIALTVVMLIQVVGIILVIALLTLPAAIAREATSKLWKMMAFAVLLGAVFTSGGIVLSALLDVPSGATVILISVAVYGMVMGGKALASSS